MTIALVSGFKFQVLVSTPLSPWRGVGGEASEACEQLAGGGGGGLGYLLDGDAAEVGNFLRDEGDIGALVALAAMGNGGEVGGIGLEEESVEGEGACHLGHGGVLEGHHAAYTEIEPHLHSPPGLLHSAAEAVHHPAPAGTVEVAQQGEHLVMSLADMQYHGEVQLLGPEQLLPQDLALRALEGAVPVEIHPYLAHGDEGREGCIASKETVVDKGKLGVPVEDSILWLLLHRRGVQSRHRAEIMRILSREGLEPRGGRAVDIGQQHRVHPRLHSTHHCCLAVAVEGLVIEVAVGVYELKIEN